MNLPNKKFYSISEAAGILGVSTKTLRRWDTKGKIAVNRTPGGNRVFTQEDIDGLKNRKESSFYTVSQAAKILGISAKTLRRWDRSGKVKIQRDRLGNRAFDGEDIEALKSSLRMPVRVPSIPAFPKAITSQHKFSTLPFLALCILAILGSIFVFSKNEYVRELAQSLESKIESRLLSFSKESIDKYIKEKYAQIQTSSLQVLGDKEILRSVGGQFTSLPILSPTNQIINSSFEGGISGYSIISQSTNDNTKVSSESIRSGTQALRFYDPACELNTTPCVLGFSQPAITTVNGRDYTVSLYVRKNNLKGNPILRIGLFGTVSTSDPLYIAYNLGKLSDIRYTQYARDQYEDFDLSSLPSNEWIRFEADFTSLPLGKYPVVQLLNYKGGTLYVDDLQFLEGVSEVAFGLSSSVFNQTTNAQGLTTRLYPQERNNVKIADNTIIADSFGNIYPQIPFTGGSLGTTSNTFQELHLRKFTIDKDGNLATSGTISASSITTGGFNSSSAGTTISISDGSAANPSLNFTNSPTTGIFRVDTDILGISTAGTERLRIDGSGNVGIGATPSFRLDVSGTFNASSATTLGSTLAVTGITSLNGAVNIGDATSDDIAVNGRVTTSIVPKLTANVDLGTTSLRWNNLWVQTINTTGTNTSGQASFTYDPADTTITQSTVFINPTSAGPNEALIGLAIAGSEKARIDTEGDLLIGFAGGTVTPPTDPFNVYNHGTTRVASIDTSGNLNISGVYQKGGVSGATSSACGASQYLGGMTVSGGIATAVGLCTTVSSSWSGLTDPTTNLSLAMGANTTTFTYNAATGTPNLFKLIDTLNNTGTGYLLDIETAAGSTLKPLAIVARGNTIIDTTSTGGITLGNATSAQDVQFFSSANKITSAGALTVAGAITAPTSTNTINSLVINAGALSGITGYTQSSGNFAISGTGTFSTGTGAISLNGATTVTGTNTFTVGTGLTTLGGNLTFSGANPAILASTLNTNISLDANGSGLINIGGTSTGDINLAGGSGTTGCTVTNASGNLACSGTIQGTGATLTGFTQGSVIFAGAGGVLSQNNANFFWDNTNTRLGIAQTVPSGKLEVRGSGNNGEGLVFGHTNPNYANSIGAFESSGLPFLAFFGRHSATINTIKRNLGGFGVAALTADTSGNLYIQNAASGTASSDTGIVATPTTASMTILNTGNVGIGTTGPGAPLEVSDPASNNGVRITSGAGSSALNLYTTDAAAGNRNWRIANRFNTLGSIDFMYSSVLGGTPNTLAMTINNAGNVGIGTTGPGAKLEVNESSAISLADINSYAGAFYQGGAQLAFGGDATASYIQSFASKPLYINNQGNNTIINPSSGNVGIGTAAPSAKLQVFHNGGNGDLGLSDYGIVTTNSSGQATIGAEATGDLYANLNLWANIAGVRKGWHISRRASTNNLEIFKFDSGAGGFAGPFFTITPAGSVSIASLVNCNTIDTNASGVLVCGTDAGASQQTFTANGTWTKPSGAVTVYVVAIGAGGGGGGGVSNGSTDPRSGGGAGGAGAYRVRVFDPSTLGATETVTIGAAGTAGTAGSAPSPGTAGGTGGNTTFGSHFTAFGGGGGFSPGGVNHGGGGGGAGIGAAGTGGLSGNGGAAGGPTTDPGGSGGNPGVAGGNAENGGGGGGGSAQQGVGQSGGSSLHAAGGGGSGGGGTTAQVGQNGGAGGAYNSITAGGGGAAGTGGASGTAGTAGTSRSGTGKSGDGGGGGGGGGSVSGGAGGAGGAPGGGGGGGGVGGSGGGGAGGGAGGRGEVIVWTVTGGAGADLAEVYFSLDTTLEGGDLVVVDPELPKIGFKKSSSSYDSTLLGIVSTQPGLVIGDDSTPSKTAKPVQLALAGRVPVKVSTINGEIKAGDPITSSGIPGVGMKATKAGRIVGIALENLDSTCTSSSNFGLVIPNSLCEGKVLMFVNLSWYDPQVYLATTSDFQINQPKLYLNSQESTTLSIPQEKFTISKTSTGESLERIGVFSEAVIGNLKVGSIDSDSLSLLGTKLEELIGLKKEASSSADLSLASPQNPGNPTILSRLSDLTSRLAFLEKTASMSATFDSLSAGVLGAEDPLSTSSAALSGTLTVLGRTLLSDLGVTGSISSGLLSIKGIDTALSATTINTLSGDLYLQNNLLGGINILSGKVTIDRDGNLKAQKLTIENSAPESKTLGNGVLPAGNNSVTIPTTAVSPNSKIFVTPGSDTDKPLIVKNRVEGVSFDVTLTSSYNSDISFDWWIVDSN